MSVEVVGTEFTVERREDHVRVAVRRGIVVVRGEGVSDGVRRLEAGQELDVRTSRPTPLPLGTAEPPEAEVVAAALPVPRFVRVSTGLAAAELLAEADRARMEGDLPRALAALAELVDRHAASPEAPIAAFTEARLLDEAGRDGEARRWYARALRLGLGPPLSARAREVLERSEGGDTTVPP